MKSNTISLEHGAGGEVMQALIGEIILKNFHNKSAGSIGLFPPALHPGGILFRYLQG